MRWNGRLWGMKVLENWFVVMGYQKADFTESGVPAYTMDKFTPIMVHILEEQYLLYPMNLLKK